MSENSGPLDDAHAIGVDFGTLDAAAAITGGRTALGIEFGSTRIKAGEDITAVFLANDQMALGLLAALHEEGLEIPDDVSVVGFDDLPEAPYFTPPLTTVRQDFAELGRRGVQLVLARLAGDDLHPEPVPAPLLIRASTGPARPKREPSSRA